MVEWVSKNKMRQQLWHDTTRNAHTSLAAASLHLMRCSVRLVGLDLTFTMPAAAVTCSSASVLLVRAKCKTTGSHNMGTEHPHPICKRGTNTCELETCAAAIITNDSEKEKNIAASAILGGVSEWRLKPYALQHRPHRTSRMAANTR